MNINIEQLVEQVRELAVSFGLNIIAALAILVIGIWIIKLIRRIIEKRLDKREIDPTLAKFLLNLIYFVLLTVVILAALSQLGIETTSFIAILGAAGLAVGLALQGSLANFASGVLLIIFRPFKVDDFVKLADEEGFVEKIQIFTTQIKTFDNRTIIIPNSIITGGKITNYTTKEIRRVDLSIGISYSDNIKHAIESLMEILNNHPKVLKDPAPFVGVTGYGDSSIDLTLRPWSKTEDYWDVFFEINHSIKEQFDTKGVSIPFPQRDVHLFEHKD
ncbi:MAG: mechanosensitive ion channel [Ignavibacteriaceae bacterium]|nr:mechanosensitive ion channel [Ignavibacteriaceae bacterium]